MSLQEETYANMQIPVKKVPAIQVVFELTTCDHAGVLMGAIFDWSDEAEI